MRTLLFIIFLFFSTVIRVSAQVSSDSTSQTEKDKDLIDKLKQIEILKEKIATKVAEVRQAEKGAVGGEIKSVSENSVTLQTPQGEKKFSFSEDTLVFNLKDSTKKETKIAELKTGLTVSAFGNFNQNKDSLLAKFIYLEGNPSHLTGVITDIDKANFTFTVKAKEGDLTVDFEKNTRTTIYDRIKGVQKSGFSKLKIADTVFIMANRDEKTDNRFAALRIINLPLPQVTATPTPPATPSS